MQTFLKKISSGRTLTFNEAYLAMEGICDSNQDVACKAAFLSLIHHRGETVDELVGFATYLRHQAQQIEIDHTTILDVCGTGGDHSGTFNISTAVALLLASGGVLIAKHGGRSVSSRCGSSDVVNALEIPLIKDISQVKVKLEDHGFVFLHAPYFNSSLHKMHRLRKQLSIRTSFNLLGPLLNPVQLHRQLIGVYDKNKLKIVITVLQHFGISEAIVLHSHDGLDEASIAAPTDIVHLKNGKIMTYTIAPEDVGLKRQPINAIQGGDATYNAQIIKNIFAGCKTPHRDIVLLNAALGFLIYSQVQTLQEGFNLAAYCIDSGITSRFIHKLCVHGDNQ